jgi:hypothetical protein
MISELKNAATTADGHPVLMAVSLAPKRRCRPSSAAIFEHGDVGESLAPNSSPVRRRYKLKRSGRLVWRWIDPKCPAGKALSQIP